MERKVMYLAAVMLFLVALVVQAQPADELHGSVGVTYQSKYVWRGFDIYGDKSAIQPEADLDLYGTGFGLNLKGHRANSDGFENTERWDYSLYYQNTCGEDLMTTNYRLAWVYYNYPDMSRKDYDLQELHAVLSWPKLLGIEGLVPSYILVKDWPSNSGSQIGSKAETAAGNPTRGTASGWAHIFMLDYPLSIPGLMPEEPEQILNFHSELIYNDGVHPMGNDVDHDWSNAVFGVSTDFDLDNNMTLTPGVYHQITMEDTVNADQDETWVTVGLNYAF